MAKKRKDKNKKRGKKITIPFRSICSLMLVIFALATANLSFLSYARDVLFVAVTENFDMEVFKDIGVGRIESIKTFFVEEKEKENIINDLPPELLLPETE